MGFVGNVISSGAAWFGQGVSTYAHEWGHTVVAEMLYENADPTITVDWIWGGGKSQYFIDQQTPLGGLFPKKIREGFIATGGPIVDHVNITLSLIASWRFRKKRHSLAITLAAHAMLKSLRVFYNYCQGSQEKPTDYYVIAKNLSVPDAGLCLLTGSVALISGIWYSYLMLHPPTKNKEQSVDLLS